MSPIFILAVLIVSCGCVNAIYVREKPSVTVSVVGTNHLHRGTNVITLIAYNPAKEKRIIYDNPQQAEFFKGREELLFTAYNVSFDLKGNGVIQVRTPVQKLPAMPPMKPFQLKFVLKVNDSAKAGRYVLYMNVRYDIIHDVDVTLNAEQMPETTQVYSISGNFSQYGTVTNYGTESYLEELSIDYTHEFEKIPIVVYVDRENVRLDVLKVETQNFVAKGKGLLTLVVENVGEKVGRNAFLLLKTPSGFQPVPGATTLPKIPATVVTMPTTVPSTPPTSTLRLTTNAVYVGDLVPGKKVTATFPIRINVDDGGNYTFEVLAVYLDEYGNVLESKPVPFGVHVAPPPKVEIKRVLSGVYVGSTGNVVVEMSFDRNLKDVSVLLQTNPPLSVISSSYYLGDVVPGKVYEVVFKVKALDEASPVEYPATLLFKYKSLNEWVTSDPIRIGIRVNHKMCFEVLGVPKIAQGEEKVITVEIKNLGNVTAREATARITIVDPFSSSDDTAYVGTIRPGEVKRISFRIKVSKDATPKIYGLDLEVKYKNPEGDWVISEPTKMEIEVVPAKPNVLLFLAVAGVLALCGIGYALRRRGG